MAAGAEHSAPLTVKYHRLQQSWQLAIRRAPFQKMRSPVLSDVFLNIHSWENEKKLTID